MDDAMGDFQSPNYNWRMRYRPLSKELDRAKNIIMGEIRPKKG